MLDPRAERQVGPRGLLPQHTDDPREQQRADVSAKALACVLMQREKVELLLIVEVVERDNVLELLGDAMELWLDRLESAEAEVLDRPQPRRPTPPR